MTGSIYFCATGKTGLGHMRRITNVARELYILGQKPHLTLITNAPVAGLTGEELALFTNLDVVPRDEMVAYLGNHNADAVVVDTAVVPSLAAIDARLFLLLRETVASQVHRFKLEADRKWDLLILPHPRDEWCPDTEAVPAHRTEAVGWIYRRPSNANRTQPSGESGTSNRDRPRILVTSGGGGGPLRCAEYRSTVTQLVKDVRKTLPGGVEIIQMLGPRRSADARIEGVDHLFYPGANLHEFFNHAELVISTVGYNSVLELACVDVPVLLIPIPSTYDDQYARAHRWEAKLGRMHRPVDVPSTVAWMCEQLRHRTRRPAIELGPSGAAQAAAVIHEELL